VYLADRLRDKVSLRTIATEMGRSPARTSREVRRNGDQASGQYRPNTAHAAAQARRPRPKPGKIATNQRLREAIVQRLEVRWSPEQISRSLRRDFPDQPQMHASHETIYQALYVQGVDSYAVSWSGRCVLAVPAGYHAVRPASVTLVSPIRW